MKRVLLIEDEAPVVDLMAHRLQEEGYVVTAKSDGASGLAEVKRTRPDLLILDIVLPKLSGLDVCSEIRRDPQTRGIPILMVTGRGDEADRVAGLEVGADDYLVKPFSLRELVARVRALLRRWNREPSAETEQEEPLKIQFGELSIEPEERRVAVGETEVRLSAIEFDLLHLLASHPNQPIARVALLKEVWGKSRHVTPHSLEAYLWRLRKKIERSPEKPTYLKTVRGVGYMFSTGQEVASKVLPIRAKSTTAG